MKNFYEGCPKVEQHVTNFLSLIKSTQETTPLEFDCHMKHFFHESEKTCGLSLKMNAEKVVKIKVVTLCWNNPRMRGFLEKTFYKHLFSNEQNL